MILLKQLIKSMPQNNYLCLTKIIKYSTIKCSKHFHTNGTGQLQMNRKVFGNVIKPNREEFYRNRDKIGENFQLIYKAPMEYYLAISKHFATFSLCVVGGLFALNCISNLSFFNWNTEYQLNQFTISTTEGLGFGVGFFLFNFMILYASRKYPLRIYKNKNSYIAIFEGSWPLKTTQFRYMKGELTEARNSILPWSESMYKMRTKSVLLLDHYFRTPSELHIMLKRK